MKEWHSPHKERCQSLGAILLIGMVLSGGPLFSRADESASDTPRHEVIHLSHITPERGKEFLARLKIGTASRLPGTDALLITAEPAALQKASAILEIVDTRTEFDVKELGPVPATRERASNEQIADAVGGISLGTFVHPPKDKAKMRGIVDVHNGVLVAIAPVIQLPDIKVAVELGPEVLKQRKALAAAVDPASIAPAIQATAMADPSAGLSAGGTKPAPVPQAGKDQPKKFALPRDIQEKLQEVHQRTAQMQTPPQPASQPDVRPTPIAASHPQQVSTRFLLGQADANAAPPLPDGVPTQDPVPLQAQEQTPEPPALEPSTESVGAAASLRPGEIVPPDPNRITGSGPVAPKPAAEGAALSLPAPGEQQASLYEPCDLPNGDQVILLNLPPKLQVIELLDLMGKYLNLSYVYDPAKVTGEVTLKLNGDLRGQMRVKDLYLLLESVLQFKDLVMTRHKGNIVKIVPKLEYLNADPQFPGTKAAPIEAGDMVLLRVFELKHIETASAENLLQGMGLTVGITAISDSKTLIVTAYAHRMERIERLLELVDRPGKPREFQFRQLKYTMAKTLAEKVKALAEQLESVTVTVGEPDVAATAVKQPGETDLQYRTRVNQLKAAQAAAARARAMATGQVPETAKPGVYLDADERTNRILMIGVEDQLSIVEGLVDALDVQQQDLRALQLYRMEHVDAEEVARKLQELGIISKLPETSTSTRITGTGRTPSQVPGQPRPPTAPTPEPGLSSTAEVTEQGLVEQPQVVVVEATNSLLVNATPEQHAKIASIIEYVDSEMLLNEIPYKIYQLKNSSPAHLSEVLESLIQETVEQEKDGKIEKTVVSRDEKIKIVPDPNTYSLIVYANKKNQEWIANLVEQLDRRRPQVLIDVTLVEVTKSDAFNYDLNLLRSTSSLRRTSGVHGVDPNDNLLGKFIQTGGGTLNMFYGDREIQALLSTMQTKNYGRVLAKPKLLVNDNQQGKIETKDTTYVEVRSAIPVNTGAAGTQTNLIQTSVNYESYDAGITLDITPHISDGELLLLDITLTRSDFLKSLPTKPPDTRTNQVDTQATLPNGSTVILGGLLKMNSIKGGSKVPLLSDIPLIGGLFRGINNEDTQSKLYVFVKAEIIRPAETVDHGMKDLEKISERNRLAFEKHELEFQKYEDWPGIKPKRIDPPKVLDAQ